MPECKHWKEYTEGSAVNCPCFKSGSPDVGSVNYENIGNGIYKIAGRGTEEYTAKVRIDFTITDNAFQTRDFIIINI